MAIKKTKRKAFNFLRSYFDVLNELQNDQDRLSFLMSIINKQFLDEDPKDLNFLVNLCYESQRHSIETSVNGWKTATNNTLLGDVLTPFTPPLQGSTPTPKQEEEEKEEVKEKGKVEQTKKAFANEQEFLEFFNKAQEIAFGKKGTHKILSDVTSRNFAKLNKTYTREDFKTAIMNCAKSDYVRNTNNFKPLHFCRVDVFGGYLSQVNIKPMAQGLIEGN